MRKSTWKIIGICVLCFIIMLPIGLWVARETDDFRDPFAVFEKDLNPDNLLIPSGENANYKEIEARPENGLAIDVKDNGSIKISGKTVTDATSDYTITLAEITLPVGSYTLSSGYDQSGPKNVRMVASYNNNGTPCDVAADYGTAKGTFTLTAETVVTITIVVPAADYTANPVTLYPVLVAGNTVGDFYA